MIFTGAPQFMKGENEMEINGQKVGKAYLNYMDAKVNLKDDGSHKVYLEWKEEKPEKLEKEKKIDYTERNAEICRLRSEGMTLDVIAKKYGITRLRVSQIVGKEKKDTLGLSPEVYYPLQRGMIRQCGTDYEKFTLKDLERAIEEGLSVHHIGETRVKEISDIFGREVMFTREYDESGSYVVILRFKKEVDS